MFEACLYSVGLQSEFQGSQSYTKKNPVFVGVELEDAGERLPVEELTLGARL